ncbi:hypothetical protein Aduo_005580 [Ancylostoma duodenale]
MAFYFALLNVSAKRDDRAIASSSHRQKRRRHSIASVESPVLDYRLLPRPQVVRNELHHDDQQTSVRSGGSKQEKERSRQSADHNRSASSSRPCNDVAPHGEREPRRGGSGHHQKEHHQKEPKQKERHQKERHQKERTQSRVTRKADGGLHNPPRKGKQRNEVGHERRDHHPRAVERNMLEREFCEMQVASSSRKDHTERDDHLKGNAHPNEPVRAVSPRAAETPIKPFPAIREDYKWRGRRPIVVKRRVSPQESSTSDSRRSSNQSNRSPPRNDSLGSSNSSRRTSEAIQSAASPSMTLPVPEQHKLSNSSMPSKLADIPRSATLKKVTFENDSSEYVVSSAFLGDRGVLVRRGSGSAVLRRSITQQLSPSMTTTTLRPLAQGTAALAGLAYGAALWAPFFGEKEETPDRQNVTNNAIEETSRRSGVRGLLRRRSTSDRHVVFGFRNEGFRLNNDETPQAGQFQ